MRSSGKIYFGFVFSTVVLSIIYAFYTKGSAISNVVFGNASDMFMDFFNHISYVRDYGSRVYWSNYNACFPPLAYVFYYFLSFLIPADQTTMLNSAATGPYAIVLYVIYTSFLICWMIYAIVQSVGIERFDFAITITLSILCSSVFLYLIERGNSAFIVCILLLRAVQLRKEESKKQKETALLFIAIAAAFKVYPAVFGILYIIEKRWKEAVRLVIYGVLFAIVPFSFFGGINGIKQFISNQKTLQESGVSTNNVLFLITRSTADIPFPQGRYAILCLIFLIMIFILFLVNEEWKRGYILASLMIILPRWSEHYTRFFMLIPLVLYMKNEEAENARCKDVIFQILFGGMFCCCTFGTKENAWTAHLMITGQWWSTIGIYAMYAGLLWIVLETLFFNFFRNKQSLPIDFQAFNERK